ncbi:hypothetical protein [Geothrix sp. 21YS21S-4]|uniref:hypothetical protein n=1 Tax=Geothrix sp. 21YS21S-4 TaxID=3068889 RepID=UPI0027BAD4EC|nr:hypothetical protein [Geothrix sp. 21YS21S-4]
MIKKMVVYNFAKLITLFIFMGIGSNSIQAHDVGISIQEFRNIINKVPDSKAHIESILVFAPEERVAILYSDLTRGWGIWVYQKRGLKLWELVWGSPKLDDSFSISSPDRFKLCNLPTGERGIQFSGCGAHNCSDIYSVMIYVPSQNKSYSVSHRLDRIDYSFIPVVSDENLYKEYLGEQIRN